MLWRFLLALIAVSCTLSRTHAHGPKDRIKDLMCVLLLSGMQKEDLDVSMLNKLQRYNVNIHDANNEDLLQECIDMRNKSNRDIINTTLSNANVVSSGQLQENENSQQTQSNPAQLSKDHSVQTINTKQEIKNDTIQYFDGKPKIDSVLKFWQDMKLKKETTESTKSNKDTVNMNTKHVSEAIKKRNAQDNSDSEEDDIKKMLENYFSKRQHNKNNKRPKKETTTTTRRSIDNMYRQLLQSRPDTKNDNFGIAIPSIFQLDRRENDKSRIRLLPIEDTKPYYSNFSEMLGAFRRLNPDNQDMYRYSKDNKILSDNVYLRNNKETEKLVSTTEKETQQKISNDMIKEIAKSVKEIVMRDLKLNIQETSTLRTSLITSTPTRITNTKIPTTVDNSLKIQESVMNKFLEMFEEIKSLKKNTIQITSNNVKKQKSEQVLPNTLSLGSINRMQLPQQMPVYNNPYQVQYPKTNGQNFNFLPQVHKFKSKEVQLTIKTPPKQFVPITFQTNNLEIPPLGIRIDTPVNPINQNIVVTTETPYRIGVIKNNLRPRNNPFSELEKFEEHVPKQNYMSKSHDNSFNVPTSYDSRYTNKAPKHHQSYYDKIRLNSYRPRPDNVEYIKSPESPRFHERLENIDFLDVPDKKRYTDRVDCCNEKYAYSKQMVECCDRKIASRQQMSLNNMKKGSYDDTHFKNFLKTQQR